MQIASPTPRRRCRQRIRQHPGNRPGARLINSPPQTRPCTLPPMHFRLPFDCWYLHFTFVFAYLALDVAEQYVATAGGIYYIVDSSAPASTMLETSQAPPLRPQAQFVFLATPRQKIRCSLVAFSALRAYCVLLILIGAHSPPCAA